MGMGEKTPTYTKKKNEYENQGIFPVWLLAHPLVYEMEADSFPLCENTENKPDLSKVLEGS